MNCRKPFSDDACSIEEMLSMTMSDGWNSSSPSRRSTSRSSRLVASGYRHTSFRLPALTRVANPEIHRIEVADQRVAWFFEPVVNNALAAQRTGARKDSGQHRLAAASGSPHEHDGVPQESAMRHLVEPADAARVPLDALGIRPIRRVERKDRNPPCGDGAGKLTFIVRTAPVLVDLDRAPPPLAVHGE